MPPSPRLVCQHLGIANNYKQVCLVGTSALQEQNFNSHMNYMVGTRFRGTCIYPNRCKYLTWNIYWSFFGAQCSMQLRSTSNVPQCDTATVHMYVLHACMHAPLMYFMHVGLNVLHVFSSFVWISVSLRQKLVANAQNGRFLTFYQKSGNVVKFSAFLRISKWQEQ